MVVIILVDRCVCVGGWGRGIYYHVLLGCTTSSSGCELGLDERENELNERVRVANNITTQIQ